jgi:hypothetical protein
MGVEMTALPDSVRVAACASWLDFLSAAHPDVVVRLKEDVPGKDDLDPAGQRDPAASARGRDDNAVHETG